VLSCLALVLDSRAGDQTVEGLASQRKAAPTAAAFADLAAPSAAIAPRILMTAKALLDREPNPSRERIKEAIRGISAVARATSNLRIDRGSGKNNPGSPAMTARKRFDVIGSRAPRGRPCQSDGA